MPIGEYSSIIEIEEVRHIQKGGEGKMVLNNRLSIAETREGIAISDMLTGHIMTCPRQEYGSIIAAIRKLFRMGTYTRKAYTDIQRSYIEGLMITTDDLSNALVEVQKMPARKLAMSDIESVVIEKAIQNTVNKRV